MCRETCFASDIGRWLLGFERRRVAAPGWHVFRSFFFFDLLWRNGHVVSEMNDESARLSSATTFFDARPCAVRAAYSSTTFNQLS